MIILANFDELKHISLKQEETSPATGWWIHPWKDNWNSLLATWDDARVRHVREK